MKKRKGKLPILLIILAGVVIPLLAYFIIFRVADDTPSYLIGSWHKDPSVAAGFNERYIFLKDGRYIYFPSEYTQSRRNKEEGVWKVKNGLLTLYPKTGSKLSNLSMSIGKIENERNEEIPYKKKIQILGEYYWKYSNEVNLWNSDGEVIFRD